MAYHYNKKVRKQPCSYTSRYRSLSRWIDEPLKTSSGWQGYVNLFTLKGIDIEIFSKQTTEMNFEMNGFLNQAIVCYKNYKIGLIFS